MSKPTAQNRAALNGVKYGCNSKRGHSHSQYMWTKEDVERFGKRPHPSKRANTDEYNG
ncbi:MAG: hypothetical protein LBB43_07785 [Spirochaetaceae bacterium]|nr:hypothetical protein [Spirochaetaceae bacterium]